MQQNKITDLKKWNKKNMHRISDIISNFYKPYFKKDISEIQESHWN